MEPSALLPVRMVNEVVYCPRLCALEWLNGEWADNSDTIEGKGVHRRVDTPSRDPLPPPEWPESFAARRSVRASDEGLGLTAVLDLVESADGAVVPVDYKRGSAPEAGVWPPDAVQVCAQGLLLRAAGYQCDEGVVYYAGSKRRVEVLFTSDLVQRTLAARDLAVSISKEGVLPPPLLDSPKCVRCSLNGICLPDEHHILAGKLEDPRGMVPPRDDRFPLYVTAYGAMLGKDGDEVVVKVKGEVVERVGMPQLSRIGILGNASFSTQLSRALAEAGIPVSFHTRGGRLVSLQAPMVGNNVFGRLAQFRTALSSDASLRVAKRLVHSKILNQRVMLRRNAVGLPEGVLGELMDDAAQALDAENAEVLMGVEGIAARRYFEHFSLMLRADLREQFDFQGRNRRPPKDPVNALLSFVYAMLVKEVVATLHGVGLDPYVGFLHAPRYGRPSLALDVMEELRPVIGDSVVIGVLNRGELGVDDFVVHPLGCSMKDAGLKRFVEAYERRLDELMTHPVVKTRLSYRRVIEVQARLLLKFVMGECAEYPELRIR